MGDEETGPRRPRTTPEVVDALQTAIRVLRAAPIGSDRAHLQLAVDYLEQLVAHKRSSER